VAGTTGDAPLDLTVWYDYHCPYSHRALEWLIGLGPERVRPRFRPFPLEQVNRDATASEWRLWEQPLDYVHYREREDRRPLHAFLATAVLEASEPSEVVDRFRLAVYRARFDDAADISDVDLLVRLALGVGADGRRLAAAMSDETALTPARAGLAVAWSDARSTWEIFGVPTLEPSGARPFYLRLERLVEPGQEASELFDRVIGMRRDAPLVLELKLPDPVE
jgi:predicted DsbA family dithiol-disulfide isomerase